MNELLELSGQLTQEVQIGFSRYLFSMINWENRLIGIKGARGTGKTTMLLQWLRRKQLPVTRAAYFSLDELYFSTHTLVDTGREFYQKGGKILVLDEVHKYPGWAREIKILYDRYKDLQIIFTGSSIIDISRQEADLSRRAIIHELHGLSYREFLEMKGIKSLTPFTLQQLLTGQVKLRQQVPPDFKPLEHFEAYLQYGYYPFSFEDLTGYPMRLRQLIRLVVEFDMAEVKGFDIRNAKKMLQLLSIIAGQVPFKPNLVKLAEKSQVHRNSIANYLYFLEEARLIGLLHPSGNSIATLQKPEKIFLNNTNLMYAMGQGPPERGSLRETFFYNQVRAIHRLNQPKTADFEVDGKWIFEIGGAGKTRKQIKGQPDAWIVKDDIEYPVGNTLPLWAFGFLY